MLSDYKADMSYNEQTGWYYFVLSNLLDHHDFRFLAQTWLALSNI